jgi:RimJ/RimL family protein N-acetyltransferase
VQALTDGVVTIRPPEPGDAGVLAAGHDGEAKRWLGPGGGDVPPTACILVGGAVVGWIDFDTDRAWLHTGEVNIGYLVFAEHRRQGYAAHALELFLQYLASTEFHTATLLIDPANAASLAVAARGGFELHGEINGERYFKRKV